MHYVLMIVGLLTACVPDDTSLTRLLVQGSIGLLIFVLGVFLALDEKTA